MPTTMSRKLLVVSPRGYRALLLSHSPKSRVIPIDATWYMPNSPHNAKEQFEKERLPHAAFFDLDAIAQQESQYPHMLPSYSQFKSQLGALGIRNDDKLVVYDRGINFSAPRAAWTLSLFGHENVYLLDNLDKYKQNSYPVSLKSYSKHCTDLEADGVGYEPISEEIAEQNYNLQVIEYEELHDLVSSGELERDYVFFDARSTDRFTGASPEPRPGLLSGHVPSALSLPFTKVLNADKSFKTRDELLKLFKTDYGIDFLEPFPKSKGVIVLCGTGVTAVILRVAIESIIQADVNVRVYDGSWTEWAQRAPAKFIVKDV